MWKSRNRLIQQINFRAEQVKLLPWEKASALPVSLTPCQSCEGSTCQRGHPAFTTRGDAFSLAPLLRTTKQDSSYSGPLAGECCYWWRWTSSWKYFAENVLSSVSATQSKTTWPNEAAWRKFSMNFLFPVLKFQH